MNLNNLGNSIFNNFNDKYGIMICGYEWGWSKEDQKDDNPIVYPNDDIQYTFSNKALKYGSKANQWVYDNRIKKWFDLWGYPLNSEGLGNALDKCIIQTNWADDMDNSISDYNKFLSEKQITNFLNYVEHYQPKIIFFMGRQLIEYLQDNRVLPRFKAIMGNVTHSVKVKQNTISNNIRFKIFFQTFEKCEVICLPHPSASRGLTFDYIKSFKEDINPILTKYLEFRGFR